MTLNDHLEYVRKEDLRPLTYAEFGELLGALTRNVLAACHEQGIGINAVAPILRSGAFPGCHLASKLGVTDVLPLQYRHTYDSSCPVRSFHRSPIWTGDAPANATILLADTNTVTGEIAQCAATDIRAALPDSRIILASVMLDISLDAVPGIDLLISAGRANERRTLSRDAACRVGVPNHVYIFPWEEAEEQWAQIQAAQRRPARTRSHST
jgi:hypothetical protein